MKRAASNSSGSQKHEAARRGRVYQNVTDERLWRLRNESRQYQLQDDAFSTPTRKDSTDTTATQDTVDTTASTHGTEVGTTTTLLTIPAATQPITSDSDLVSSPTDDKSLVLADRSSSSIYSSEDILTYLATLNPPTWTSTPPGPASPTISSDDTPPSDTEILQHIHASVTARTLNWVRVVSKASGTPTERRLISYAQSVVVERVNGYWPTKLWERTCLSSYSVPSLRYVMTALASMHDQRRTELEAGASMAPWHSFGLTQYNKAMAEVRALGRGERGKVDMEVVEVILTTCFLFGSVTMMMGDARAAIRHADNGIGLMNNYLGKLRLQYRAGTFDAGHSETIHDLFTSYRRLDVLASQWVKGRKPMFALYQAQLPKRVGRFESMEHAGNDFDAIQHRALIVERNALPMGLGMGMGAEAKVQAADTDGAQQEDKQLPRRISENQAILQAADAWETAFNALVATGQYTSEVDLQNIQLKMMNLQIIRLKASEPAKHTGEANKEDQASTGELGEREQNIPQDHSQKQTQAFYSDSYTPLFMKVVECARVVTSMHAGAKKQFVLYSALIHPLRFVAEHCGDETVRKEAVVLMRRVVAKPC